jgi:hypothetical protein
VLRVTCSPVRAAETRARSTGVLLHLIDVSDQAGRGRPAALGRTPAPQLRGRAAALPAAAAAVPAGRPADRRLLPARRGEIDLLRDPAPRLRAGARRQSRGAAIGRTEFQVGGDWYDVIPLGAGRTGLVMGDVMGRGVHAAAIMGQLRAAVRAYAAANLPPGELMLHLDRHAAELEGVAYARGLPGGRSCDVGALATCGLRGLRPGRQVLTYARAGHPAPLLRRSDGTVVDLDAAGGPPLGTGEWTWQEATSPCRPDAYLALYTDGLVERRGADLDVQIARLREVFAAAPQIPAQRDGGRGLEHGDDPRSG